MLAPGFAEPKTSEPHLSYRHRRPQISRRKMPTGSGENSIGTRSRWDSIETCAAERGKHWAERLTGYRFNSAVSGSRYFSNTSFPRGRSRCVSLLRSSAHCGRDRDGLHRSRLIDRSRHWRRDSSPNRGAPVGTRDDRAHASVAVAVAPLSIDIPLASDVGSVSFSRRAL